jgi:hypothetical protein
MTQNQFTAECRMRTLEPSLVLENDKICEALSLRDDEKVILLLESEF